MRKKICPTCKKFFRRHGESKKYWRVRRYCSIKCSGTLLKKGHLTWNKGKKGLWGSNSPSYKGGKSVMTNGYVRILIPGTGSYQLEHRLVMEKKLGRKLKKGEIVHHINHNRQDNREENLELFIKNEHDRMETKNRWENNPSSFNHK